MSNTQNIPVAFGTTGTLTPIPATTTDGTVNLSQGYTSNYSLDLTSNPNALPVERDKFNWLMNLVTNNLIDWQTVATPQWNSSVTYYSPALVRYSASSTAGTELLYRCLGAPPAGTPPTNTTYWEVEQTSTALIGMIPERDQGQITIATNLNTIAKGWYSINGVLQACPNAPPTTDTSGVFECYTFGTPTMYFQRFIGATTGASFVRTFDGANWHGWNQVAYRGTTLESYGIVNGLFGRGNDLTPTTNLNTIQPTTGEVHVLTSTPLTGYNYPELKPGVLMAMGYNTSSSANMTSQVYMATDATMWARLCLNGTWQAWAPIAFNVQTYITNLLASNNTWTGTNTFNNLLSSTLANGLSWQGLATAAISSGAAGVKINAGPYSYNFQVGSGGNYGIANGTTGTWNFSINDSNGYTSFDSAVLSLNANRARGSVAFVQGNIPTTTSAAARLQFENNGSISFYALNGALNGFAPRNYVDTQGNFSSGGSIFAAGNFYSANGSGASFGTDGNIGNSSIISANRGARYNDLNSALNDRAFYVTNAQFAHDIRLYWDGQMETWVDGGYQGTMATQSWVGANYWDRASFLRPDQGSWGGNLTGASQAVVLPGGGVWAYLYLDILNSNVSRFSCGVAAGGTTIWPAQQSQNTGMILRWRIY